MTTEQALHATPPEQALSLALAFLITAAVLAGLLALALF